MNLQPTIPLETSATVAINTLALQKKARGERVFNLAAGEPVLPPHQALIAGADAALAAGKTLYTPAAGIPELRVAASTWMNRTYQTNFEPKNTLVTCGGKFGIFATLQAYLTPGDEVAIISPYWVSYPSIVQLFGGVPRIVETEEANGWKLHLEQLKDIAPSDKIKILILNNAANPTGAIYSYEEIKSILGWAQENNVLVISDEVYSGLVYDGKNYISCGSFPEHQDHVVVIQSCSKHFSMTGWRVGFVFALEEIIRVLTTLQSQSTTGTSSISQWAALAAFEHASEIIPYVREKMETRRNFLIKTLTKLFNYSFIPPASSLYVFVNMQQLGAQTKNSVQFCTELIEKHNIALVPGNAFGAEGYVRLSFGAAEAELEAALNALHQAISKLALNTVR